MGGALSATRDEGERMWNGIGILVAPRLALSELYRQGQRKPVIPESVDRNHSRRGRVTRYFKL